MLKAYVAGLVMMVMGVAYSVDVIDPYKPKKAIQPKTLEESGIEVRRVIMERVPGLGALYCDGVPFEEAIKKAAGIERSDNTRIQGSDTLKFKAES